jgi:tetratricopeptide (TPR) repeat protein
LRQDIIKTAMDGLQQVSRSAENAPLADRSVGVAHQRMGDIHEQVGETEEAIRQYNLSLAIFDKLLAQDPSDAKAKFAASVSYDKLGGMVRDFNGDAATALDRYNKSLQLRLELADPNIKDLPLALKQKALAVSYIKLADLNHVLGNPEMAREHARKSLEQSEASLAADAKDGQAKQFVAFACFVLGQASVSLQEIEAARAFYDRSLRLRQELADEDPLSVAAKRDLGTGYDALGDLELSLTNHTAAREHYQKGREIREGLYEKDPRNAEVQWDLSYSHYHLGIVAELLDDSASSKQAYQRC